MVLNESETRVRESTESLVKAVGDGKHTMMSYVEDMYVSV